MNLKAYKTYLKSKHYKPSTIIEDCLNMDRFIKWLKPKNVEELERLSTPQIVEYINHLQQKQLNVNTINIRLRSIRKYYDFLKNESCIVTNPVEEIKVKGAVKKVIIDPLDYSDLEELYKDYSNYKKEQIKSLNKGTAIEVKKAGLKRKLMLGFMVFQGLHTGELKRLEVDHIQDEEGTIYIMGRGRTKARELRLNPIQMRPLFQYMATLPVDQTSLFIGNLNNQMTFLCVELRGLNQKVQNGIHIRASVIMHWLKLHGKRQTQYMIGHKWISSTEYYELQDLEALTNLLDKYHPLATG